MKYSIHQLEIFLSICKNSSITRAAEELDLTQPAVSIQLRNFQNQFTAPLTETLGRQIYITDFGREIEEVSKRVINEVEHLNSRALGHKQSLTGRLKISVVSTGKYVMPYFLSGFLQKYGGVELKMDVTNREKVLGHLSDNEVDFALVSLPPGKIPVEAFELLPNKLFLVGSSMYKFDKTISPKEIFKRWPLIMREPGSGTRMSMERYLERNHIVPSRRIELTSNEAVKQAVVAGIGLSVMPLIGLKHELSNKEIKILPNKGLPIRTSWRLVWLKGKTHSNVAQALLTFLKSEKSEIQKQYFSWCAKF